MAEKAASEEKEWEREPLAEWMPHGSQEMQEESDDGPCAYRLEASVGNCGKLKCIFRKLYVNWICIWLLYHEINNNDFIYSRSDCCL